MAETLATEQAVAAGSPLRSSSQALPGGADGGPGPDGVSAAHVAHVADGGGSDSSDVLVRADASAQAEAERLTRNQPSTEPEEPVSEDLLVWEGDVAGDYLERLLDLVDYDGDIDLDVEGDRAVVSIDGGDDLEKLVGSRGVVLEALQELTRLAVQQQTGVRSRLMLDVAQWRSARRAELSELGRVAAERVRNGGEPARLHPMTPFERKIVHDAVASVTGVFSQSEGEEPRRCVVVYRSA